MALAIVSSASPGRLNAGCVSKNLRLNLCSKPYLSVRRHVEKQIAYGKSRLSAELNSKDKKAGDLEHPVSLPDGFAGSDLRSGKGYTFEDCELVGEDAALFDVGSQKFSSWIYFTFTLGAVAVALYFLWIDPSTGYGTAFIQAMSSLSENHEVVMLAILFVFALVHSGMASFRSVGEDLIGERAYRVVFAGLSLPLAVSAVVYFINHRYDGTQLWQVRTIPGVHEFVWLLSFVSFFFLYPSTFNLLEVAAIDKPKFHMWATGIMRITRHPQMVGQFIWCLAHTIWIGNSFTLTTSLGLLAHHLFGVWNGDRRLAARYGKAFEVVKDRTSVIPFLAILQGRQKLPKNYYQEFLRVPYVTIVFITLGAYISHPLLQIGSYYLHW